jgi:hypothetical protein
MDSRLRTSGMTAMKRTFYDVVLIEVLRNIRIFQIDNANIVRIKYIAYFIIV